MDDRQDIARQEFMDKYGLTPEDYVRMYEENPEERGGAVVWMVVSIILGLIISLILLTILF